jgi:hypothetical protein
MTDMPRSNKLVALLLLVSSSVLSEGLATLVLPPGTKTVWVAEDIKQNGVPMQIQQLTSSATVAEVLKFYRSQWADSSDPNVPGFVENQVGEWQTISQLINNQQTVVQVKTGRNGGTEGYVSQIDTRSKPGDDRVTRNFPRKSGTQLISSTASKDGAKISTTILLMNTFSVVTNTDFYKLKMPGKGWSLAHTVNQGEVSMMLFNRPGRTCEIAISKNKGRTIIMANIQVLKT